MTHDTAIINSTTGKLHECQCECDFFTIVYSNGVPVVYCYDCNYIQPLDDLILPIVLDYINRK